MFTDVTAGERHEADLVVRGRFKGQDAFFLIHVEHQSKTESDFGRRMFRYFARLHEAHDLLTIRAVRIETRVLMSLQALVRPSGEIFLFRTASGVQGPATVTPPLSWKASYPLLEQTSTLVVLEKRQIGYAARNVSRETS